MENCDLDGFCELERHLIWANGTISNLSHLYMLGISV